MTYIFKLLLLTLEFVLKWHGLKSQEKEQRNHEAILSLEIRPFMVPVEVMGNG